MIGRHRSVKLLAIALLWALQTLLHGQSTVLDEGLQLFREGKFEQALVKLQEAHKAAPRDATIENVLGITEVQLGHLQAADSHFRRSIALDPSKAAPHRNLGFSLLTAKLYADAEPELREASRLDPKDNFAHYYLFQVALATGHDAEALLQATRAGDLIANDPDASQGLIEAKIRTGDVRGAARDIERMEQADQLTRRQIAQLLR